MVVMDHAIILRVLSKGVFAIFQCWGRIYTHTHTTLTHYFTLVFFSMGFSTVCACVHEIYMLNVLNHSTNASI